MKKEGKNHFFWENRKKIIFPLGLFPTILFYIQNAERMKTELLHKYFRGETTEKEESQIVEWTESSAENKERFLKERMLFDITLFSDDSKIQRKPKGRPLTAIIPIFLPFVL